MNATKAAPCQGRPHTNACAQMVPHLPGRCPVCGSPMTVVAGEPYCWGSCSMEQVAFILGLVESPPPKSIERPGLLSILDAVKEGRAVVVAQSPVDARAAVVCGLGAASWQEVHRSLAAYRRALMGARVLVCHRTTSAPPRARALAEWIRPVAASVAISHAGGETT